MKRSVIASDKSNSNSKEKKISGNDLRFGSFIALRSQDGVHQLHVMFIIIPLTCSYEKGLVVSFTLAQRVSGGPVGKSNSTVLSSDGLVQSQPDGNENSTDEVKVTEGVAKYDGQADKKLEKKKKHKRDKEVTTEEDRLEINLKSKKPSTDYGSIEREGKTAAENDVVSKQNNSAAMLMDKVLVGVQDWKMFLQDLAQSRQVQYPFVI